jgi:acyl-coenzyme A synthetase/AMP-(fatty) acid ligase
MCRYTVEERVFIVRTYWKTESIKVMSTAIPGELWRPTSAEQVQHLGLVEETGNQGDFIGRTYRRTSKNVRGKDQLARNFQNMARRVQSCLDTNGGHFQHML